MIRHAPERRYEDRMLWRHPLLMEAELEGYVGLDAKIEGGAVCGACSRGLDYPLVEVLAGMRAVLLHPDCARRVAEGIAADVEEIEQAYGRRSG